MTVLQREGTVVGGDFRVERLLGKGGMGAVYLAHQMSTGRLRALKLLHVDLAHDPMIRQRFAEEARVPQARSEPVPRRDDPRLRHREGHRHGDVVGRDDELRIAGVGGARAGRGAAGWRVHRRLVIRPARLHRALRDDVLARASPRSWSSRCRPPRSARASRSRRGSTRGSRAASRATRRRAFRNADAAWRALEPLLANVSATGAVASRGSPSLVYAPTALVGHASTGAGLSAPVASAQTAPAPKRRSPRAWVAAVVALALAAGGAWAYTWATTPAPKKKKKAAATARADETEDGVCPARSEKRSCLCKGDCTTGCWEGGCAVAGAGSGRLVATCAGGNCDFVCRAGSTCNFSCGGGNRSMLCEAGATCDMRCKGQCDLACDPKAKSCKRACEQRDCLNVNALDP